MKKTKLFTLATLSLLLASCGGNSTSTSTTGSASASTAPTSTVTPSGDKDSTDTKPTSTTTTLPSELTDDMLGSLIADDVTFGVSATSTIKSSGSTINSFTKDTTLKLGEDVYSEAGDYTLKSSSSSSSSSFNTGYYKGSNNNAYYCGTPDLNNVVTDTDSEMAFDDYFTNPFAERVDNLLDSSSYDYKKTMSRKGYTVFELNDEFYDDVKEDLLALDSFYEGIATYGLSYMYYVISYNATGTASTLDAKDITVNSFTVNADADNVIGFTYDISVEKKFTSSNQSYDMTFSSVVTVNLSDIYSTDLTKADVQKQPYTKASGTDTQYAAFDSALSSIANGNYLFKADVKQQKTKYFTYEGAVLTDEYSILGYGYNDLGTQADMTEAYYSGYHKVSTGVYDYYSSDTATIAKGSSHTSSCTIPSFDFSSLIFEYDATNSTSDAYVFTLRDSYDASDVLALSTVFNFSTASGLTVTVNKDGSLKSMDFSYISTSSYSGSTATYYVTMTFSDIGTTTTIPTNIADFSSYTPYKTPTSYADITDDILDYGTYYTSNGKTENYADDLPTVIKAVVGEDNYSNVPDVFAADSTLGDMYSGTLYATEAFSYTSSTSGTTTTMNPFVEIHFGTYTTNEVISALSNLSTALKNKGYTVSQSGYTYTVTGTGFKLSFGASYADSTYSSYIMYVEITAASTSTSTTTSL